ncbi:leucine-rich repeat, immunoglobulin-like domain and transmembrane domain-containing protein 3 [Takifugu rubripes]|nr:leucine-rich repeat, immunoglobulin-like domain and transmembrane domain-containing protein 3 [Takifugu rubripes]
MLDLWFPLLDKGQAQRRILGLQDNPWICDCQISMLMSLSMSLGSPVVLMDQLLICSRAVGQSTILLTPVQFSHCMRPSIQPAATRVISPLGSNVILRCDATGYPTPALAWIKTSAYTDCCQEAIADSSLQLPRFLESFMQDSPRVGVRWSIIILNGLSYEDAGEYRCQARNMAGISEALIKLKVVGVTSSSHLPKRKSVKTGAKASSKYRRPSKAGSLSVKDQQVRTNVTSSYLNREQLLTF